MIVGVADTHTAIWFLAGAPQLSANAKSFIEAAAASRNRIAISSIALAEIVYLIEKRRLPAAAFDDLRAALINPEHVFVEASFTIEIVEAMRTVSREEVPDMPDRMISATAVRSGVPLIGRDGRIRASSVPVVW